MEHKKTPRKLLVLIGVAVVLVLGAGAFAYSRLSDNPNTSKTDQDNIDYSPATKEEKQDSEQRKDTPTTTTPKDTTDPKPKPDLSTVTPVIVDASQYGDQIEVRSYVPGIYEDGGACTIIISKNSLKVTKQAAATRDATTTRCANTSINRSEFQEAGQWTVTVSYLSSAAQGSSQPKTLEVK